MDKTPEEEIRGGLRQRQKGRERPGRWGSSRPRKKEIEKLAIQSLGPAGAITVSRDDPCTVHAI